MYIINLAGKIVLYAATNCVETLVEGDGRNKE